MALTFDQSELARKKAVIAAILEHVSSGKAVRLPAFDREANTPGAQFALESVGNEPNDFNGTVGPYRYQFEGEDDLLHMFVTRKDRAPLTVDEGRQVASFVLEKLPPALIWLRPGEHSQHFYVAHDDLLEYLR